MKIDGVEYKFKEGVRGNNDANRRFVGYIAQQIESVVPQAVQLIDGVLHVDYESLIPYLSESIKQNFKDLNNLQSKTDQIHQVVDMLYNEFVKREQKRKKKSSNDETSHSVNGSHVTHGDTPRGFGTKNKRVRWVIGLSIATLLIVSAAIGFFFVVPYIQKINSTAPLAPISPPASPAVPRPPSQPLAEERLVLEEFFHATNGGNWTSKGGWLTQQSICQWDGITCNKQNQRVKSIFLGGNNLLGTIPDSIGDLEFLERVTLHTNSLYGQLPASLGKLKNLQIFTIESNKFNGTVPESLFSLPGLTSLVLTANRFAPWKIPAAIGQLTKLQNLEAHKTNLFGTIPQELADLPNLEFVQLSNNDLHGTLPTFYSQDLEEIIVSNNQLNGSVNSVLGLKRLQSLHVSNNNFSGEFAFPYESIDSLTSLMIENNRFTSTSHDIFNASVPNLLYCNAFNNRFACPIPDWMTEMCHAECTSP
jgi:hypothetical protein